MEEFEYEGIWWLPENTENPLHGSLKYSPEGGANLEVHGSLITSAEPNAKNKPIKAIDDDFLLRPTIILGKTINGKAVTLYKCIQTSLTQHFPGLAVSQFTVYYVFVGCHFIKEDDIVFKSLLIDYSNLDDWSHVSGFKEKTEIDHDERLKKLEITYESPRVTEVSVNKYRVSISFSLDYKSKVYHEYNLKQKTIIKMASDTIIHFNSFISEIAAHIQNFLCLAIGNAIYPNNIIGISDARVTKFNDGKTIFNPIDIFYKLGRFSRLPLRVDVLEMLFYFEDIMNDFKLYLNNWINKAEILQPVYDLYFGILYNPSLYLNYQFLSLVQALESYHRRRFDSKYTSDDDFDPIREIFINAIPKDINADFRDSLKNKFKYLHEYSLKKRLGEILCKFKKPVKLLTYA
jgi:hypothetical protein